MLKKAGGTQMTAVVLRAQQGSRPVCPAGKQECEINQGSQALASVQQAAGRECSQRYFWWKSQEQIPVFDVLWFVS